MSENSSPLSQTSESPSGDDNDLTADLDLGFDGAEGHVGFAVGQDDTHFFVLGGNQSDAVTIARIAKSRLLGARWPTTYPPRHQRLPTMKQGEFIATTNEI